MAHSHAHSHEEVNSTYFLDQLCTIAVCGLLGVTAILAFKTGMLERMKLHPNFHIPVLIGGWALLVMVVLRAASIWRKAGASTAAADEEAFAEQCDHGHQHAPGEQCDHEHQHKPGEQCDHGHDHAHSHGHKHSHGHEHSHAHEPSHSHADAHSHGHAAADEGGHEEHDHGWSPWQYAVLIIPAVLFFLGLPSEGFNMTRLQRDLKEQALDSGAANRRVALAGFTGGTAIAAFKKSGGPVNLKFSDLTSGAERPDFRNFFEGKTVALKGQFAMLAGKDNMFNLFRVKISCCATDAINLKTLIVAIEPLNGFQFGDWVQIEGEITFQKVAGRNEWLPVIQLPLNGGIMKIDEPKDAAFQDF